MTEDELVAAIAASLSNPQRSASARPGRRITVGIGDDAALWQPSRSHRSAISTDMLVEGVDFAREMMSLQDAGWRAMAANLSDLAATGARPVLALVALGIPQTIDDAEILQLYGGVAECANRYNVTIAGGDLSRAPVLTIAITVVGDVRASRAKTRAGGRPGDVLAVTGPLGAARAGLELLRRSVNISGELHDEALRAFRRPQPRIAEGRFFAASRNVTAMMDLSDGLSSDVHRLAEASGCGAKLDTIAVARSARAVAEAIGEDPQRFALAAGEDFELLVAFRPRAFRHLAARYAARFKRDLLKLGMLSAEPAVSWNGTSLERLGWDHFQPPVR